jgi:hypothetical protein
MTWLIILVTNDHWCVPFLMITIRLFLTYHVSRITRSVTSRSLFVILSLFCWPCPLSVLLGFWLPLSSNFSEHFYFHLFHLIFILYPCCVLLIINKLNAYRQSSHHQPIVSPLLSHVVFDLKYCAGSSQEYSKPRSGMLRLSYKDLNYYM